MTTSFDAIAMKAQFEGPLVTNTEYILKSFTGASLNGISATGPFDDVRISDIDIEIDANGSPDTFKWRIDGGAYTTGVAITGAFQTLTKGVTVRLPSLTGNTIGHKCTVRVIPTSQMYIKNDGTWQMKNPAGNDVSSFLLSGGDFTLNDGKALRMATGAGKTLKIQAYNNTSLAYVDMITLTEGNPPTMNMVEDIFVDEIIGTALATGVKLKNKTDYAAGLGTTSLEVKAGDDSVYQNIVALRLRASDGKVQLNGSSHALELGSDALMNFFNGTLAAGAADVGFKREAAGIIGLTDGASSYEMLKLKGLEYLVSTQTLAPAAATFAATRKSYIQLTGDAGGNTVTSITGGAAGQILVIQFMDSLVTIDSSAAGLKGGASFTGNAQDMLVLINGGGYWEELDRKRTSGIEIVNVTATVDGLTTGAIAKGAEAVAIVSSVSTKLVSLPGEGSGNSKLLYVGNNGCRIQTDTPASVPINNTLSSYVQMPAKSYALARYVTGTGITGGWIVTMVDLNGLSRSILGAVTGLADVTDVTKKLVFDLSGMTTAKTLTLLSAQATDQTLTVPVIREAETLAIKPQIYQATPADPTGTTNTTGKMMGLAGAFTPQVTGRARITISGDLGNDTILDGAKTQIRFSTGAAPANGDALGGTTAGALVQFTVAVANQRAPFSVQAQITGLALNTAIWIDLGLAAITGGTATAKNISITVEEL